MNCWPIINLNVLSMLTVSTISKFVYVMFSLFLFLSVAAMKIWKQCTESDTDEATGRAWSMPKTERGGGREDQSLLCILVHVILWCAAIMYASALIYCYTPIP